MGLTFLEAKNRYRLHCLLRADEGLHVGAGRESDHTDSPFIRRDGRPFLPASSIRGVLRSYTERILFSLFDPPRSCILFADPTTDARLEQLASVCVSADEKKRRKLEQSGGLLAALADPQQQVALCPVCRLFGSTLMAAKLKITDGLMTTETATHIRDGVGIDRDTESAHPQIKFDFEVLDPHAGFTCDLIIENATSDDFALLHTILQQWKTGGFEFGGKRSRGFGLVRLQSFSVEFFDETQGYGLRDFLTRGAYEPGDPAQFESRLLESFQTFVS